VRAQTLAPRGLELPIIHSSIPRSLDHVELALVLPPFTPVAIKGGTSRESRHGSLEEPSGHVGDVPSPFSRRCRGRLTSFIPRSLDHVELALVGPPFTPVVIERGASGESRHGSLEDPSGHVVCCVQTNISLTAQSGLFLFPFRRLQTSPLQEAACLPPFLLSLALVGI